MDGGESGRAVELAERFLRQTPAHMDVARAGGLELLVWARTARGELEAAEAALDALRESGRLGGTRLLRACADLAAGRLAIHRGDHDHARPLLEDAIDGYERAGAPFEAAQARIELAGALRALGRDDDAEREAAVAVARLADLGAEGEAERARRLRDGGVDAGPPLPTLTPREREVLGLLAVGLTNRQIAEQLVVSEHTVHRHVTNILRKLELPSRAAAAAAAVRSGVGA
jgi:DNA-binding NarL/FixJ family response regulator